MPSSSAAAGNPSRPDEPQRDSAFPCAGSCSQDGSCAMRSTLPHLPFPGLLRDGPPKARLRKMRTAFICHRQRRFAFLGGQAGTVHNQRIFPAGGRNGLPRRFAPRNDEGRTLSTVSGPPVSGGPFLSSGCEKVPVVNGIELCYSKMNDYCLYPAGAFAPGCGERNRA